MKHTILALLVLSSLFLSCSKSEILTFNSKDELVKSLSQSSELKEFFELSKVQSNILFSLLSSNIDIDKIDISGNVEVEKLQRAKKACMDRLLKSYRKTDLQTLYPSDFKRIVQNISLQVLTEKTNSISTLGVTPLSKESCAKEYQRDTNECFHNFVSDEIACFAEGFWGIVGGCHVQSIKDQYRCNRAAEQEFKNCK